LFHKDNNDKGKENESHELELDSINLNKENKLREFHLVALTEGGVMVLV
jgi:hypothetical protein